ncbi:hypothetical protein [Deinococcus sp. QL22]|uniref:hypothetical protein n=1 Tax=Deinococcus sp. QL22 TaxID=2939437 RepID=UPI0020173C08|nr:hypothetical protein [Deinococcus sp. QL22]UQN09453.1 hypothetical protein M1R55_23140 [Deinococcus sp. QL22]
MEHYPGLPNEFTQPESHVALEQFTLVGRYPDTEILNLVCGVVPRAVAHCTNLTAEGSPAKAGGLNLLFRAIKSRKSEAKAQEGNAAKAASAPTAEAAAPARKSNAGSTTVAPEENAATV